MAGKRILFILLFVFSTVLFSQAQEYKIVEAKSGQSIYSILKENNIPPEKYTSEFVRINQGKIGKNNKIFVGTKYKLPLISQEEKQDSKNTKSFEIFGDKYSKVEIVDSQLAGAVYYLVAGHGGPDPGAIGKYNNQSLCEDEYAYDVVLRLGRELISHGALVYIIIRDPNDGVRDQAILKPDHDELCYPEQAIPLNQNSRLAQRKNAVNKLYKKYRGRYQRAIIVHVDSRSKKENIDVFFYYFRKSSRGKKLCTNLQKTFEQKYAHFQPDRGYSGEVSPRNLYMLKYSHPVAAFIELGNINHPSDQKRFIRKSNRQALAQWLCDGLILDFKNNK